MLIGTNIRYGVFLMIIINRSWNIEQFPLICEVMFLSITNSHFVCVVIFRTCFGVETANHFFVLMGNLIMQFVYGTWFVETDVFSYTVMGLLVISIGFWAVDGCCWGITSFEVYVSTSKPRKLSSIF
jgi:hypothetical protein